MVPSTCRALDGLWTLAFWTAADCGLVLQTAFQYRNLKLESQRKSLVYQKKFLASVVHEFDLTCRCRTSQTSAAKKRFK